MTFFCTCSSCRGVTAVHFRDYALGCLGFIPGTVAYVFIGTTASSLLGDESEDASDDDNSSSSVQLIVIIVGAVATVIAIVLISVYAKRALSKVLEEDMEEDDGKAEGAAGEDVEAQDGTRPAVLEHVVRVQSTA